MIRVLSIVVCMVLYNGSCSQLQNNETVQEYPILSINQDKILPRANGHIQFENENTQTDGLSLDISKQVRFRDDLRDDQNFQNPPPNGSNHVKKKRRKKPKQRQIPFTPGSVGVGQTNQVLSPNYQYMNHANQYFDMGQYGSANQYGHINRYPNNGVPTYRPHHPPPSIASQALSTVTEALTSIARYDDYQCVPRLLCEAAGGGSLGNSQLLQTASRLQPLLAMLSAYNGISTNPLFVFGRAVFLGVSSKENSASCRYAYPRCPTDTEDLVHYLNNYNGGFFRFFSAPQQGQQGVEHFYNQLSAYGLYQPNPMTNQHGFPNLVQNYGFHNPGIYPGSIQQNYGFAYPYSSNQMQFKNNFNESKIEKRIQTKPFSIQNEEEPPRFFPELNEKYKEDKYYFNGIKNGKTLKFPNEFKENDIYEHLNHDDNKYIVSANYFEDPNDDSRDVKTGKILKFPEDFNDNDLNENFIQDNNRFNYDYTQETYNDKNNIRNGKKLKFPGEFSNDLYKDYVTGNQKVIFPRNENDNEYSLSEYNDNNAFGNKYSKNEHNDEVNDGSLTVYVVRGNGDPNHPEVVKLKPGETIK